MDVKLQLLAPDGKPVDARSTGGGIQLTMPYKTIWTARRLGWQAMATAAVAALVVRPTTTAMATLYNNNATKYLVIDRAFAHNLVAVANSAFGLWLCVHPVGMAKPTNDITVRNNTGGAPGSGSSTIFDNSATVVDDGWFLWGVYGATVTVTTPGAHLYAEIDGRIVLPPSAAISLQVVASTTGATFTAGFGWFELEGSELGVL